MSFLARTTPRLAASRATFTSRAFSTSFINRKTPVETVKDAAKTIDRAVSDKLVDGIEAGQAATQKVKEVSGISTGEMKGKASEVMGQAKGKANEMSGTAKGKANEMGGMSTGEMKGKANEVMGEAKGKANELAGEAKGKKEEVKGKM